MVVPESIHTSNIITNSTAYIGDIYVYKILCVHAITINEKWGNELDREWGGYMGEFGGKEGKQEM